MLDLDDVLGSVIKPYSKAAPVARIGRSPQSASGVAKIRTPSPEAQLRAMNRAAHARLDGLLDPSESPPVLRPLEWIADSIVALIKVQECRGCGGKHQFSMGWFTGHFHVRDKTARKLTAGKPQGSTLPTLVERVDSGYVEVCGDCAESQLTIGRIAA